MITTCRFNDVTWAENCMYRERMGHTGCLYGVPMKITGSIPLNTPLFVVEMNNTTNKVEGIGLILNMIEHVRLNIYPSSGNHTRYIYKGDRRISRETMEEYNPTFVALLDVICFKGYKHMKRGNGFMRMTPKILSQPHVIDTDVFKEINEMFLREREKEIII